MNSPKLCMAARFAMIAALDQETGNDTALEDRRHQKQLDDLTAAADAAGKLNSAAYQQAVSQEDALHALKLKNIESEADAQKKASGGGSSSSSTTTSNGSGDISASSASGASGSLAPALHFDFTNSTFIGDGSSASNTAIAETIARMIKPQLDAIAKRSR